MISPPRPPSPPDGPAPRDVFLAAESEAAIAAVASFHENSSFIDKHVFSFGNQ